MTNEIKKTVKKTSVKTAAKKAVAKPALLAVIDKQAASVSYKQAIITASNKYITRRIASEGNKLLKTKRKEIEGFNLASCQNVVFQLLESVGFESKTIDEMGLTFYAKALQHAPKILNAIATKSFVYPKNNCLAGVLIDIKRACNKEYKQATKKELAFNTYAGGLTGGANPHACMLGLLTQLFGLGTWDDTTKVIKFKPQAIECFQTMHIESEKFYSKGN